MTIATIYVRLSVVRRAFQPKPKIILGNGWYDGHDGNNKKKCSQSLVQEFEVALIT